MLDSCFSSVRRRRPSGNAKLDVGKSFDFLLESVDESGALAPAPTKIF